MPWLAFVAFPQCKWKQHNTYWLLLMEELRDKHFISKKSYANKGYVISN